MFLFAFTFSFIKILLTFPVSVEGPSMIPTLYDGDTFFASMYEARFSNIDRGDVVVFGDDYLYVKRVIGVPGDRVVLKDGGVEVNGEFFYEPYARGKTLVDSFVDPVLSADVSGIVYNVPLDSYFVLGDNRENSVDSRNFVSTFVKRSEILGVFVQNILL